MIINCHFKKKSYLCKSKFDDMYKPISIDRKNLAIMGVRFPDLATLDRTASAIGSNMYAGFVPSEEHIRLYLDLVTGKIDNAQMVAILKKAQSISIRL